MPAPIEPDLLTEPETLSPRDQLVREIMDEIEGVEAEYQRLDERMYYWNGIAHANGLTHGDIQSRRRQRAPVYEP